MYRRKVTVAAAAVFAIGVALQPNRHPCGRIGVKVCPERECPGCRHEYLDVGHEPIASVLSPPR